MDTWVYVAVGALGVIGSFAIFGAAVFVWGLIELKRKDTPTRSEFIALAAKAASLESVLRGQFVRMKSCESDLKELTASCEVAATGTSAAIRANGERLLTLDQRLNVLQGRVDAMDPKLRATSTASDVPTVTSIWPVGRISIPAGSLSVGSSDNVARYGANGEPLPGDPAKDRAKRAKAKVRK